MNPTQIASAFLLLSPAIEAATFTSLTVQPNLNSGSIDLTALGTTHWAAWDSRSADENDSILSTSVKTGGTGVFSGIYGTDGSDVRSTELAGSDILTITNILTVNGGGTASSRSMLLGAAVSVIPEPSLPLLSALGALSAALRRRVR